MASISTSASKKIGRVFLCRRAPLPTRTREQVGVLDGFRWNEQSWKELRLDVQSRELLAAPQLALAVGTFGFWKAVQPA